MNSFRSLDDVDVKGKRVLVRVDLNVPMQDGKVLDATRIEGMAPTITEIADKGGKVILLSHFGRPKGRDAKYTLRPVAAAVAKIIKRPVAFADDCVGPSRRSGRRRHEEWRHAAVWKTPAFIPGEENNNQDFAAGSPSSAIFSSTTLFRRRTASMPRPKIVAASCCRPMPDARCRPSSKPSTRRSTTRRAR